jgi:hypothetical protein
MGWQSFKRPIDPGEDLSPIRIIVSASATDR